MGRTLADVGRAAETQAAEFGAAVDLGAFDLAAAEALLRANVADTEADAIDNPEEQTDPNHDKRTTRSRQLAAMLAAADPNALRAVLEALPAVARALRSRNIWSATRLHSGAEELEQG